MCNRGQDVAHDLGSTVVHGGFPGQCDSLGCGVVSLYVHWWVRNVWKHIASSVLHTELGHIDNTIGLHASILTFLVLCDDWVAQLDVFSSSDLVHSLDTEVVLSVGDQVLHRPAHLVLP